MMHVGKPVTGRQLVGRAEEISQIIAYLKMGQSVVLIAPRRFGKTSLVIEVLRQLKRDAWYTGLVDIFATPSIDYLSHGIVEEVLANDGLRKVYQRTKGNVLQLIKSEQLKAVVEDFEFLIGMQAKEDDDWSQLEHSVDFIDDFTKRADRSMVFAFDEYGDILKFDKRTEIVKMMHGKMQRHKRSAYLFCGSYESVMQSLFVSSKSPFYRMARIINLTYLPFEPLKRNIVSNLRSMKVPIDVALIDDMLDYLKCHPYYSQLAAQQIFLYYSLKGKLPSHDELIDAIIATDASYIEKTWEELKTSKEERKILIHLSIQSHEVYSYATRNQLNASRALKSLMGKGILYKSNDGYHYYDPILQHWVATRMR